MERSLYQWQEECLRRWQDNGGRGMVQAVTGSGKTLLALTAAARLEYLTGQKLHVKIVVPTGTLMRQWSKAVKEFLQAFVGEELVGLRGGGYKSSPDRRYMIYVINSARYELARQILAELRRGDFVFLIADECHHYGSGENRLIFEFLPHIGEYEERFFTMGLSATLPSGRDRRYLSSVLGRRIYTYGMAEASAMGTVCRYDIYHIRLSFDLEERQDYEEMTDQMNALFRKLVKADPSLEEADLTERFEILRGLCAAKNKGIAQTASRYMTLSYKRKSLVCLAASRVACACDLVDRLGLEDRVIIFGERIHQAEELYRLLSQKYPGRVGRYHSKLGQQANRNALERFRTGEVRLLIACKSMDEGVDVPDAAVGIILSGTSTQRQRTQRLGRILRRKDEGRGASLYYLHIEETSEDSCFLPEGSGHSVFELEYCSDVGKLFHPIYDKMAEDLLDKLRAKGMSEEKIREARRCLELGSVRGDWARGREYAERNLKDARYIGDRNYWICMKKLAEYERESDDI